MSNHWKYTILVAREKNFLARAQYKHKIQAPNYGNHIIQYFSTENTYMNTY